MQDSVKVIRNLLDTNVTDPISSLRSGRDRFVMTAYPKRPVEYPIITVKLINVSDQYNSGARSELKYVRIQMEIRVWARNEKEKDGLAQDVYNVLRTNEFGSNSTSDTEELHDFVVLSSVPVEEEGEAGIKSQVLEVQYSFVLGA